MIGVLTMDQFLPSKANLAGLGFLALKADGLVGLTGF